LKKYLISILIIVIALSGCTKDERDKKPSLDSVIIELQEALFQKDSDKFISLIEKETPYHNSLDPDSVLAGQDFISFETIEESLYEETAIVKLQTKFVEPTEKELIGIIIITLNYINGKWLIHNIETEIDPSTRGPQK